MTSAAAAQWVTTAGPLAGSRLSSLAGSDSSVVAAVYGGAAYISRDTGATWKSLDFGSSVGRVRGLACRNGIFYAGTSFGLFASTDEGNTWASAVEVFPPVDQLTAFEVLDTTILIGSTSGLIYRSTDKGKSWTHSDSTYSSWYITCFAFDGRTLFAGRDGGGIMRSTDNGLNWSRCDSAVSLYFVSCMIPFGGKVFAGAGGLYCSADSGLTWSPSDSGFGNVSISGLAALDGRLYAGTENEGGIFVTTDVGESWEPMNTGLPDKWVLSLGSMGKYLFAGTLDGVFFLPDSGSMWLPANLRSTGANVYSIAATGKKLFAGTNAGVFLSTNNGSSWTPVSLGLTSYNVTSLVVNGDTLLAATYDGLMRSENGGRSWTAADSALAHGGIQTIIAGDSCLFVLHGDTVFISRNGGRNWEPAQAGRVPIPVTSAAVSGPNLVVGTWDGILRSTDAGFSWVKSDTLSPRLWVGSLFASGNRFFLSSESSTGVVFVSDDAGATWRSLNKNLTNVTVCSFGGGNGRVFAGTDHGVYVLSENDSSWIPVNSGLPVSPVYAITYSDSTLFAGVNGKGVWREPIESVLAGVSNKIVRPPSEFLLEQNYPNPFNPTTNIGYRIADVGFVTLKVYDVLGRRVATLVNKVEQPGSYRVQFNGSNLASGVYFYRLDAGGFVKTMKMLLLK